jgi:hypothetical protein
MSGDLRTKVKSYVEGKRGQQDGNGECWTLAENALKKAGAKTSWELAAPDQKKNFENADYIWGKPIKLSEVKPGCILQFRNYRVDIKRTTTSAGGGSSWKTEYFTYNHHTAIAISAVTSNTVKVLHQNVPDDDKKRKLVVEGTVYTGSFKDNGKPTSTEIKVSGKLWAYEPLPESP